MSRPLGFLVLWLGHASVVEGGIKGLQSFARDYKERARNLNRIEKEMRA